MLSANNISVHFGGNYLFDGISFNINPKDRIGLIGRNGTGKTTLLKIIYGLDTPEEGTISKPKEYELGYLPQEGIVNSDLTVYEETKTALTYILELDARIKSLLNDIASATDYQSKEYFNMLHDLDIANEQLKLYGGLNIEEEIEKVLLGLGFSRSDFFRNVNVFSGGWQMRIELAKILLRKPDLVLLDEPTNHLDIDSIEWLENYLRVYNGAIMLVSHDRNFLNNVTNRTIEIANMRIYDMDVSYNEFMELRQEQREQTLNAYRNQQKQIEHTEKFIEKFRYKSTLASRVQSRIKQLDKIERIEVEDADTSSIDIRFPEPPRSGRLVAEAKLLSKNYGALNVLNKINFEIERGEKVAFVGKNGEGKSTFSRILAYKEDYTGELNLGFNVETGFFAQHQAELLSGDDTVFDVIDRAATGDMRSKIRSLLGAFLFSGDSVYKKVKVLSGGEKSRLALAKLILQPVNFLILDEPTNHLDMAAKDVLKKALIEFKGALVIVSHDRDFLNGLTDKTYYFSGGNIRQYLGGIYEFLDKHKIENLNELEKNQAELNKQATENSTQGRDKSSRIEKKNFQKEENKLKKVIASIESEIEELEALIQKYEEDFQNADIYSNIELMNKMQTEYKTLRNNLNTKMEEWANSHTELENFQKNFE